VETSAASSRLRRLCRGWQRDQASPGQEKHGPVVDSDESEPVPGCFSVAHIALSVLMFLYWGIVQAHPCDCPESAYVNVSAVASLVAFGCIMLAAFKNWPKGLLVAAMGASVVAVVAAFVAFTAGWDFILPLLTILLTVLPTLLLLTWSPNQR
jgi:hypothetical protein